jgi:anti-sigma B factor antagonist
MLELANAFPRLKNILSRQGIGMDLDIRQSGSVCVLKIKSALKYGESVTVFEKSIESALESGHSNLIIDLEFMSVIDSCGIGSIVNALLKAKKQGGDAKLVNPSPFAMKTMKLCGIYGLFSVYSSESDAVAACS